MNTLRPLFLLVLLSGVILFAFPAYWLAFSLVLGGVLAAIILIDIIWGAACKR